MDKHLPINGELFSVRERPAFLIALPRKRPSPWVWYAPTLPRLPGDAEKWMFEKFLAAGLAIAGIDVGESYGSPEGRALYLALYQELVSKRGFSRTPCLLARSRGGLMLYNWACEHPACVACIAGIYPVCDLRSYPGLKQASDAYRLSTNVLDAQLCQHNPIARLAALAEARIPIFHIHGDCDTLVPLEDNSAELARRYRRLGGKISLVIPRGKGHDMWSGYFQCPELVDFVIDHAG